MTAHEFRQLLRHNREAAIEAVMRDFVQGCLDDGPEEIARVLAVWATHDNRRTYPQLDLGDDAAVLEHAQHYGTVNA
jgi:hypothetical protein